MNTKSIIRKAENMLFVAVVLFVGYCIYLSLEDYQYQGQPQDLTLQGTIFEKHQFN